ncbi:MAG: ABC-type sugar transport system periplasmic component-like protein, partial [Frankiales bacterium]|nr:ABC-type sugar transport system periplasmic component-like protein [Frankiales bacterium]
IVASAVCLAACGSSDSCSSASSSTTPQGGSSDAVVVAAKKAIAASHAEAKTIKGPSAPVTPPEGKTLGVIACGVVAPPCLRMANGVKKAAAALGWEVVIADGKLTVQGMADAMDRLIGQKVDGILNVAVADSLIPNQMTKAKKAGIPVVCMVCGNKLVAPVKDPSTADIDPDYALSGRLAADYAIAHTNGQAKVVLIRNDAYASSKQRIDTAAAELKKCPGCKIVATEQLSSAGDLVRAGRNQMQGLLNRYPKADDFNYVIPAADTTVQGHIQVLASQSRDIKISSFDCDAQNVGLIRAGKVETACVDGQYDWVPWAATDQMARILAKAPPAADEQTPVVLVDKSNVPPAGQDTVSSPDFPTYYKKIWGKG